MASEYVTDFGADTAPSPSVPRQSRRRRRPVVSTVDNGLRGQKRMAYRFAQLFRNKFIYTAGRGWLEWDGVRWRECGEGRPWQAVEVVCRHARDELPDLPRADQDDLLADIRACDSATGTAGVLRHAAHWPGIWTRDEDLDRHAHLLVCANGTYDLYRLEFRPSDPADLMTRSAGVAYDPDATCPLYDQLLATYQPDPAIRAYLHRLAGAALEGRQNLQHLVIHYGPTAGNGKGTIQRAWQHVFGEYAHVLPVEALLKKRGYDQYRDEKAQLQGKRLVYLTEPDDGMRWDAGVVKSLTGGDPVTARALYRAAVTFEPSWLIMVNSNARVATSTDGGMARRIREIPWTYTIPRDQIRDDIDPALRAEGSGILNRLLAGWRDYRDHGIQTPDVILKATEDYLQSVDPVRRFLDECVVPAQGARTPVGDLYLTYTKWCSVNGEQHVLSKAALSRRLVTLGYEQGNSGGRYWAGVMVVPPSDGEAAL